MPTPPPSVNRGSVGSAARSANRGPAAAAENRAAILAAAHRLFAERGYLVPLNAIAKEAGVGQGVLYRHFPNRLDLAFTVFEQNLQEFEAVAGEPGPHTFGRLWNLLLEQTVREAAFVEMMLEARLSRTDYDGETRLRTAFTAALVPAREAGLAPDALDVEGVLLAWRMAFGIVATAPSPEEAWSALQRAFATAADGALAVTRP